MKNPVYKPIVFWLFSGCFLVFLMVAIGGITRLTGSGLSMVEWDLLMGTVPPMNEQQWVEMFEKYKQFPEYQKLNYHFELEDFKSIFWWEYIHRLLGRLIGIVFLIPFIYFWMKGKISRNLMTKLLILFILGAFQGFLGWYMVKSGLVDDPYVSHYRLAIHLIAALATFAFALWFGLDEWHGEQKDSAANKNLVRWTWIFFAVLILQIIYGAFVAGLKAGYVFTTWPKMGNDWFPQAITIMKPFYINFLESLAGVQFVHRYLAYVLIVLAGIIFFRSRKHSLSKAQQKSVAFLMVAVAIQAILGIFTLIFSVPVILGVIHQSWAFVLVSVNLILAHRLQFQNKKSEAWA